MNWHEYFTYDPLTGVITWKERPRSHFSTNRAFHNFNNRLAGKEAGHREFRHGGKRRRIRIEVNGRSLSAHVLAWHLMGVRIPDGKVPDHIDRDPFNNAWSNLRAATVKENSRNQCVRTTNKSGFTGVYYSKNGQTWMANIRVDGTLIHLGTFPCKGAAAAARAKASMMYFKEFSPTTPKHVTTQKETAS